MTRKAHARVFFGLTAGLVLAHVFAPSGDGGTLGLAWLPWDLGYHLLWMLGATFAVLYMTEKVWPKGE